MKVYRLFFLLFVIIISSSSVAQQRFDVLISEIMFDPAPTVGLPNVEYIELMNRSGNDINLKGWRIVANTTSAPFPDYLLPADSFVVITTASGANLLASYGKVLAISSFPSLPNDGGLLVLTSKENRDIHFVSYRPGLHANEIKAEGGWSLELMDPQNPCTGSNWTWSTNDVGGTPGRKNSVARANADDTPPRLQNAYLRDAQTIVLEFDEAVDSAASVSLSNFSISPSVSINAIAASLPRFSGLQLQLSSPVLQGNVYTIKISGVKDCAGNEISHTEIRTGLPQEALANDVIINEILFNPKTGASDYVELYNRSNKIIDASKLFLANRNGGAVGSPKKLSENPYYLFPGDYTVVTEDATALQRSYLVKQADKVLSLTSFPSFPDDEGVVVLAGIAGNIIDEVAYKDDWHFALVKDAEGVALERVDPDKPSQDAGNWHSAASTAGWGTPTYRNSQYRQTEQANALISITPKTFSPDNDGYEDLANISYKVETTGYVANISIFNSTGKMVRHLVKNATLGLSGSWNWDGLDEQGQKLPIGTYIIYTELFNLQGKKKSFKNAIVLARRLR